LKPIEALNCYNKALAINDKEPLTWYNKGKLLHEKLKDYNEALSCFNKTLDIKPLFTNALIGKLNVLTTLGRYNEALEIVNREIEDSHNHNRGTLLLGKCRTLMVLLHNMLNQPN
jgi:tetratricopeptide (TPR) repeat protein